MNNPFRYYLSALPVILFIFAFSYGCAPRVSVDAHIDDWLSRPLSELRQSMDSPGSYASKIGWKERTYPMANGNYGFVEPYSEDCFIHWTVNQRDKIIGYAIQGDGCERTKKPQEDTLNSVTKQAPLSLW